MTPEPNYFIVREMHTYKLDRIYRTRQEAMDYIENIAREKREGGIANTRYYSNQTELQKSDLKEMAQMFDNSSNGIHSIQDYMQRFGIKNGMQAGAMLRLGIKQLLKN